MPATSMRRLLFALLPLVLITVAAGPSLAAKRVALVIGNNAYEHVTPLLKAANDAETMAGTLARTGFAVTKVIDAPRRAMNLAVQKFVNQIEPGDVAMVFFAGHGVEIRGENFLLPTDIPDAAPGQEDFVTGEAISLNAVLDRLKRRQAQLNIVILDACRNNPFQSTGSRSLGASRGLARVNAPKGTFVMYSADAGEEALDRLGNSDSSPNSVFTRTLVPMLERPGVNLVTLARETRRQVRKLARGVSHEQTPAYYDAVLGDFYFTPGGAKPEPPVSPPSADTAGDIETDYQLVQKIGSRLAWEAFIEKYAGQPDNFYVRLAKAALQKLAVGVTPPKPEVEAEPEPEVQPDPPAPPEPEIEEVTRSPRVIPVGKWPEGVAWDGRFYWVAESGQRQIAWIDPRVGRVRGRSKVGRLPVDIFATSRGVVYAHVATDRKIWRQTGPRRKGRSFTRLAHYGQRVIGTENALYALQWLNGSSLSAQITRIDLKTKRKVRSKVLPKGGFNLAVNDRIVISLHRHLKQTRLLAFDKDTLKATGELPLPGALYGLAVNANNAYVTGRGANGAPGVLIKIRGKDGQEAGRMEFPRPLSAVAATDGHVVALAGNGVITVIDDETFKITRRIRLSTNIGGLRRLLINGSTLAITTHKGQGQNGTLLLVDDWLY
ncbi:MAG: caspase family protein [Pseudomonadota bacterium]